jgi:hypothetical protein
MIFLSSQGRQISFRAFAIAIGVIATILLLMGLLGFWYLTAQNPSNLLRGTVQSPPEAAVFVPRQAPVMVSLLASPEQLVSLGPVLGTAAQQTHVQHDWQRLKNSLQTSIGIAYDTDIQPWVGNEITFAITDIDIDKNSQNGLQPGYLLALAIRDGDRAREFLELFWQRQALAGQALTFQVTNGVRIIHAQAPTPGLVEKSAKSLERSSVPTAYPPATAVVGNQFLLLASDPQILERSIQNAQAPDLNLDHRPDYQNSLGQLNADRLGLTYVNLPQTLKLLGLAQWSSQSPKPIPQAQTILASISFDRQGLRFRTALSAAPQVPFVPQIATLTGPVEVLQQLPANTVAVVSGDNLAQLWRDLEAESSRYSQLPAPLMRWQRQLSPQSTRRLMLQLQTWLSATYALGCLSTGDWIFVAEHTPQSDSTLAALDRVARDQGLTVSPLTVDNHPVTAWTRIKTRLQNGTSNRETTVETDIIGLHTTVNHRDLLTTSLSAMSAALAAPQHPLTSNSLFKGAIAPLDRPNQGIAYLNWSDIHPVLHPQPLLQLLETTLQPFLKYVKTIAISSYGGNSHQRQGDILVRLTDR